MLACRYIHSRVRKIIIVRALCKSSIVVVIVFVLSLLINPYSVPTTWRFDPTSRALWGQSDGLLSQTTVCMPEGFVLTRLHDSFQPNINIKIDYNDLIPASMPPYHFDDRLIYADGPADRVFVDCRIGFPVRFLRFCGQGLERELDSNTQAKQAWRMIVSPSSSMEFSGIEIINTIICFVFVYVAILIVEYTKCRRRIRLALCPKCSYNMGNLQTSICPECGPDF